MKKYGLQLRFRPDQENKIASRPPIRPPASIFGDDNDDDGLTKELSCQSSKSRSLQMVTPEYFLPKILFYNSLCSSEVIDDDVPFLFLTCVLNF